MRRVRPKIRASIVMFTYFNPIMRRGAEQFCRDIKAAGASGEPLTLCSTAQIAQSQCLPLIKPASLMLSRMRGSAMTPTM